jgi:hypothetical protein
MEAVCLACHGESDFLFRLGMKIRIKDNEIGNEILALTVIFIFILEV